jgi:hypothetical protein
MLPHELMVWAMTTGPFAGALSCCGAADAEAPQVTDATVTAAAAMVRRTRLLTLRTVRLLRPAGNPLQEVSGRGGVGR